MQTEPTSSIFDDPRQPWDYVLEEQRSLAPELQTVFHLRPLSVSQRMAILDSLSPNRHGILFDQDLGTRYLRSLRAGLAGWTHGGHVPADAPRFEVDKRTGAVSDASLERFSMRVLGELARAIENGTKPTAALVEKPVLPPS